MPTSLVYQESSLPDANHPSDMLAERDLYWLAGLLEGEASFHLIRSKSRKQKYAAIKLKMCDLDIIQRAKSLLGGNGNILRYEGKVPNHKAQFVINITDTLAVQWMKVLYPLLGERRQNQISAVLDNITEINLTHKFSKKLNRDKAAEIREMRWELGISAKEIAILYNIDLSTVYRIANNLNYRE